MDIVVRSGPNTSNRLHQRRPAQQPEKAPAALAAVREDLSARAVAQQVAGAEGACLCAAPTCGEPKRAPTTADQQVADQSKPSAGRLRQLLSFERRRDKSAATAVDQPTGGPDANGYFAYSPVVQSSSELAQSAPARDQPPDEPKPAKGKSSSGSWLKSKFSLSSANLHQEQRPAPSGGRDEPNQRVDSTTTGSKSLADLLGPERRAETITIKTLVDPAQDHHHDEEDHQDDRLIRPRSVLSATSAELLAAQRSLALAAAAKVQNDRLARLASAPAPKEVQSQPLTVKTSTEPLWVVAGRAQGGPMVSLDRQGKLVLGGPQLGQRTGSGGSNSVGMSDSSPSNNGAESDNSIQTSATNNSAEVQQTTGSASSATSSPLGILSRILLNNKRIGQQQQQQQQQQQVLGAQNSSTSSSEVTLRAQATDQVNGNGSMSSPSLAASPSGSNRSPPTYGDTAATGQQVAPSASRQTTNQRLGQLECRSRCPIVLSRSNELAQSEPKAAEVQQANGSSSLALPEVESEAAPQLPAKGVLKNFVTSRFTGASHLSSGHQHQFDKFPALALEPSAMNGLPRVASYSQLPAEPQHPHLAGGNHLCNYHALNRSHMIQAQYSPYLPYNLGRYSIHETCDPSAPMLHSDRQQVADCTSAVNYGYYLGDYPAPGFRSNGTASSHEQPNRIYHGPSYPHDDSIYIPYAGAGSHRDPAGPLPAHYAARPSFQRRAFEAARASRPKSSLDTFLLSTASCQPAHHNANPNASHNPQQLSNGHPPDQANEQSYGRRLSATSQTTTTSSASAQLQCNEHDPNTQMPLMVSSSTSTPANSNHRPADYNGAPQFNTTQGGHRLLTENSIYASNRFDPKSELTVLPTGTSSSCPVYAFQQQQLRSASVLDQLARQTPAEPIDGSPANGWKAPAKHKSLVRVNQTLQSSNSSTSSSPVTKNTTSGKLTRVSIGSNICQDRRSDDGRRSGSLESPNNDDEDDDDDDDDDNCTRATVL